MKAYLADRIVDFDILKQDVIRFFSEARLKKYNSAKGVFEQRSAMKNSLSTFQRLW